VQWAFLFRAARLNLSRYDDDDDDMS
jgi:hypothetical protein